MSLNDLFEQFTLALTGLHNEECWGVVAGKGTGSNVLFDFGMKIPREKPLKNQYLSEVVRNNESEKSLFVRCVWRIISKQEVICGCWEDNSNGGPMLQGLERFLGSKVVRTVLSCPGLDLNLEFDNGLTLQIFCDSTDTTEEKDYQNYWLTVPAGHYVVNAKSKLVFEE
jgi:hypothetical protein